MTESMTRTVVASLVLSASLVACGQSGSGAADEPVPSITGRWALVGWVDPVGVELRQAAAGSLTGGGCAYGAPPLQGVAKCDRVYPAEFYGAISGAIAGAQAKFGFQFGLGEYSADVTVSADGKRMGGLFSTSTGDVLFPTAWLPVTDGDAAPATSSLPSASADYELRLSAADSGATEYVPGQVYDLYYRPEFSIFGALGGFSVREMARSNGGSIEVGPVSPTRPEFPGSLSITTSADDVFTSVTARLANGHSFTFDVTPRVQ